MSSNVPAVYDVLTARIEKCAAFLGLAKCGWSEPWECNDLDERIDFLQFFLYCKQRKTAFGKEYKMAKRKDIETEKLLGIYCRTSKENRDIQTPPISRQRNIGIKFAQTNKLKYELYEDEGKSGYKISEDEFDPMNNRPGFSQLINDIKSKKIDRVWVWEHSRLSRNSYASAFIFNIFEKFNITLYENEKVFDLNNPEFKLQRQVLDAISEYERHLIVNRMNSGKQRKIDQGERTHPWLFGYQKSGKDDKGHIVWKPVKSEIEVYKYSLKKFNKGESLKKIYRDLVEVKHFEKSSWNMGSSWISRTLKKYQYTGYQLTIEGFEIYKRFNKYEIESISILEESKYWVKSIHFKEELISIKEWVDINHKLKIKASAWIKGKKNNLLAARADIATGLMECGDCGSKFYYRAQATADLQIDPKAKVYRLYYHLKKVTSIECHQKPHSFSTNSINEVFKIFYFYFYLVFDNTMELSKKTQQRLKIEKLTARDKAETLKKEVKQWERQIPNLKKAIETETNIKTIQTLATTIAEFEERIDKSHNEINQFEIEIQIIQDKFDKEVLETTYYDVQEKINDWFKKLDNEQRRNELIKVIKTCKIFNHYILIDTGTIAFLFDIHRKYVFDIKLLERMNRDEIFKSHFIELKNKKEVRKFDDRLILNFNLSKNDLRELVLKYMEKNYNIAYNLNEISNLISFESFKGLYSQTED
jgi:DNA invertase Pin-like site-specific DNA recombinase